MRREVGRGQTGRGGSPTTEGNDGGCVEENKESRGVEETVGRRGGAGPRRGLVASDASCLRSVEETQGNPPSSREPRVLPSSTDFVLL